jgi:hypothetical protein
MIVPSVSHAETIAAGLSCESPDGVKTNASNTWDDLLACIKGKWISMVVPAGAVMPFNLTACPTGWIYLPELAGRTVMGAGQGEGLTYRNPGETGGEESHTMTLNELVPHAVTWTIGVSDKGGRGNGYAFSDGAGGSTILGWWSKTSDVVGEGQPFNIMMPWVSLIYCQKQ